MRARMSAAASTSRSASPAPEKVEARDKVHDGSEITESKADDEKSEEERVEGEREEAEQSIPTNPSAEESRSNEHESVTNPVPPGVIAQGDWQAIWSAQHSSYYFHNTRSGETTWSNPLVPDSQGNAYASSSHQHDPAAAAIAAGIDPELAYLDPSFALPAHATEAGAFQAKFNARTGAFAKPDARDPTHLGEWERAQRMSSVYFDTSIYDQEVQRRKREEEEAEGARKKKKITKKDLVCRSG